jgi:hypothetical protein
LVKIWSKSHGEKTKIPAIQREWLGWNFINGVDGTRFAVGAR